LAQKAFYPAKIPFPLLHIDTTYKFKEMIAFRNGTCRELGLKLIVHTNQEAIEIGANPFRLGTTECCALLKTKALLDALKGNNIDAAIGGARRDEEKSRAKERVFSLRDAIGQGDPRNQRPEIWDLYNTRLGHRQTMQVFPLSNWTELDIWEYIHRENISVVPLYFAKEREMLVRDTRLIPIENGIRFLPGERPQKILCRMRSLGCTHCTGAIRSTADSIKKNIEELKFFRRSERENRLIDHDKDASMELKKQEGYF
jgi:sulfate adenylyltransferase subunit 2